MRRIKPKDIVHDIERKINRPLDDFEVGFVRDMLHVDAESGVPYHVTVREIIPIIIYREIQNDG